MKSVRAILGGLALVAAPALSPTLADEAALKFGASTYKQFCAHCHGLEMVNPGTSSYDLRKFPTDQRPRFESAVLKGKGDMPAWGDILTAEEVDAIWRYVATRAGKEDYVEAAPSTETTETADAAPDAVDEVAELKFGASTYKQFCAHCHGLDMVNPGTSSYDLRKFPTDQRPRFESAVLKGKGDMPAWGDILTAEEMSALWRYVATRAGKDPFPGAAALEPAEAPLKLATAGALTACLARNGGTMSGKRSHGGVGLDYELAAVLAEDLDLDLIVTWFESEQEEESTPVKETYAMLSYGLCDISPGFALYEPALGRYAGDRGPLPRWDDRPDHLGRSFHVDLAPIAVSAPYARMEIGLVVREGIEVGEIDDVADLAGLRLGAEQGTLPGIITLRQGGEAIAANVTTLNPGPKFLWEMETGLFDAALVTVGAYDFHRRQNSITTLQLTDYRHPLGFNLGVAMLADRTALKARIDASIERLVETGALRELAEKGGAHYAAPKPPHVQPRLTMQDIVAIR